MIVVPCPQSDVSSAFAGRGQVGLGAATGRHYTFQGYLVQPAGGLEVVTIPAGPISYRLPIPISSALRYVRICALHAGLDQECLLSALYSR